jgi:hypothetical protein
LCTQPLDAAQQSHQTDADVQQQLLLQQHGAQQAQAATQQQLGAVAVSTDSSLQPPIWPEQFKSVMFQNRTNKLALVTLYYDWKLGANLNIISSQLGAAGTVWDLEWNNGAHTTAGMHWRCTCTPIGSWVGRWYQAAAYRGPAGRALASLYAANTLLLEAALAASVMAAGANCGRVRGVLLVLLQARRSSFPLTSLCARRCTVMSASSRPTG